MAHSIFTITKRTTFIFVRENGFFVSNSKELSQTIIQLLENDELRLKMGKKSRQMVTKFDWQKVAESIIHEYNTITSSSK